MPPRPLSSLLLGLFLLPLGCGAPQPPVAAAPSPSAAPGHGHDHGHHHHGDPLVHRFQKAEDWAKDFDDPARDAWQRPADVIAAMRIEPGMTVADLGAGTGYFEPYLARAVGPKGRVLALDIEPDMVRYLKERAAREQLTNVAPALVTGDDPKLPAGGVDRVLIVDTWHHIPERAAYAAKLRAALAPGGAVCIVDFTQESHRGPPPEHRVPKEQVIAELKGGGLTAEAIAEELPDQFIVVGKRQ